MLELRDLQSKIAKLLANPFDGARELADAAAEAGYHPQFLRQAYRVMLLDSGSLADRLLSLVTWWSNHLLPQPLEAYVLQLKGGSLPTRTKRISGSELPRGLITALEHHRGFNEEAGVDWIQRVFLKIEVQAVDINNAMETAASRMEQAAIRGEGSQRNAASAALDWWGIYRPEDQRYFVLKWNPWNYALPPTLSKTGEKQLRRAGKIDRDIDTLVSLLQETRRRIRSNDIRGAVGTLLPGIDVAIRSLLAKGASPYTPFARDAAILLSLDLPNDVFFDAFRYCRMASWVNPNRDRMFGDEARSEVIYDYLTEDARLHVLRSRVPWDSLLHKRCDQLANLNLTFSDDIVAARDQYYWDLMRVIRQRHLLQHEAIAASEYYSFSVLIHAIDKIARVRASAIEAGLNFKALMALARRDYRAYADGSASPPMRGACSFGWREWRSPIRTAFGLPGVWSS